MKDSGFLSTAQVNGRLYRIDWYPGLILDDSAGPVIGEVFEVSHEILNELDAFEGDDYQRVKVDVSLTNNLSAEAWLWTWNGPTEESQRITGGDWLASG